MRLDTTQQLELLREENRQLREENEELVQLVNRYRGGVIQLIEAFRALGRPGVVLAGRRR